MADRYGIRVHKDWGRATAEVKTYWKSKHCDDNVCAQLRTRYRINPGESVTLRVARLPSPYFN